MGFERFTSPSNYLIIHNLPGNLPSDVVTSSRQPRHIPRFGAKEILRRLVATRDMMKIKTCVILEDPISEVLLPHKWLPHPQSIF